MALPDTKQSLGAANWLCLEWPLYEVLRPWESRDAVPASGDRFATARTRSTDPKEPMVT